MVGRLALLAAALAVTCAGLELTLRTFAPQYELRIVDAEGRPAHFARPGKPYWQGSKPNFRGRLRSTHFDVALELDERGFRPVYRAGEGGGEPLHVVLLGDSYTWGWGVEYADSWGPVLARELARQRGAPVVLTNRALPGTGQWSDLYWLRRHEGPADLVIDGLYVFARVGNGNDLVDNLRSARLRAPASRAVAPFVGAATEEAPQGDAGVGWARRFRRWIKQRSHLYRLVENRTSSLVLSRLAWLLPVTRDDPGLERAWNETERRLGELAQESRARGAPLVLAWVPNQLDAARRDDTVQRRLAAMATDLGAHMAPSPLPEFERDGRVYVGEWYFPTDGHWTARAHGVMGRGVARWIHAEGLDAR